MPFVALVIIAFGLGIVWNKVPSRKLYFLFIVAGSIATVYFMR